MRGAIPLADTLGLNMPNKGGNVPNMGMKIASALKPRGRSLAGALFSNTQQRVLGLIFGQPDRSFYATELINLAGSGSGAVQRELARLEETALVTVKRIGTQKHYQANPASPLFAELCAIVRKTVGLAEPLRKGLALLAPDIVAAFVFGSVAKKQDTAVSDIDVMVVSDSVSYADLFGALEPVALCLNRAINPVVYTTAQFAKRRRADTAFIKRVMEQPRIWLIGSEDALGT